MMNLHPFHEKVVLKEKKFLLSLFECTNISITSFRQIYEELLYPPRPQQTLYIWVANLLLYMFLEYDGEGKERMKNDSKYSTAVAAVRKERKTAASAVTHDKH